MTIDTSVNQSISEHLSVELFQRDRMVLASQLARKFRVDSETVQTVISEFLTRTNQSSHPAVTTLVAVSADDQLSVVEAPSDSVATPHWVYGLRPGVACTESVHSFWKRDRSEVKTMMGSARPALWSASNSPSSSGQRQVAAEPLGAKGESTMVATKVAVESERVPTKALASVSERVVTSQPVSAPVVKAAEKTVNTAVSVKSSSKDDSSVVEPEAKKIKTDPPHKEENHIDSMSIDSSSHSDPQFRDVVIKKKVVVTEYTLGPNNEMIVKDVEKMVEEVVREPVKSAGHSASVKSVGGSSNGAPKPSAAKSKEPPAGQGKLTSFFKKN